MGSRSLCIFDLDGTLFQTESSFLPTMRRIYQEYGVSYPGDESLLAMVGEPYATFLEWLAPQGFPADVDALTARITEIELGSIKTHGRLYPFVEDTLTELRDRGSSIALCTNGDRRYADYVLRAMGILNRFDALKTNDDRRRQKVDRVRELIAELKPRCAYMIGDRYHDVGAGNANGCVTVGAAYGYGAPAELESAVHVIKRFSELLEIVNAPDASGG